MTYSTKLTLEFLYSIYNTCPPGPSHTTTRWSASHRPLGTALGGSVALGGEAAEDDGDPEGKAVPADLGGVVGQLGHSLEPVADGVRMDEQQVRGRLERGPLLQVGHQRVNERRAAGHQRLVHVADQGRARVGIAV